MDKQLEQGIGGQSGTLLKLSAAIGPEGRGLLGLLKTDEGYLLFSQLPKR